MVLSQQNTVQNGINKNLVCAQNYIRTLSTVSCERNKILQWFNDFCAILTETINLIGAHNRERKESIKNPIQKTLLLYLTQLLTSLSLLINILSKEEELDHTLTEARNCVVKQIVCCLEGIESTLNTETTVIDPSGTFVKWMDAALDKIVEIDVKNGNAEAFETCKSAKELFEEVLSHAMSIAQVSLVEDTKMIKGSCQAVLSALNSLTEELHNSPPNGPMVNLFIDVCSNKLCMLEKRVNTSVLRLCLKTFASFTAPLQVIKEFCFDQSNKSRIEELDSLVVEFDLHVDRIMQIGLFAVSCSNDLSRGIKIRSCLASLEALESELVPALTSVLLDNSVHNVNCANLLMAHWLNQAHNLQQLIYLIIDPFAFCQIVHEEAAEIINNLSRILKNKTRLFHCADFEQILSISGVLKTFLTNAQTEFSQSELNKVKSKLKDFNNVLDEVNTASKVLLTGDKLCYESCVRILKRCKILLTVLKRLWHCFVDEIVEQNADNNKSVKYENLQVENSQQKQFGNVFIDHIINRGQQILQDRSVLYKSPMNNKTPVRSMKGGKKEIPLSRLVHLRRISFINNSAENETSLDLQITDILGEMTNLSTNFR